MSWAGTVFSMELRRSFSYRMDFWVQFLGSLFASAGIGYFLWRSIFSMGKAHEIEGYTLPAMVLYYLLIPITAKIVQGVERGGISTEIYEGGLTRYLVYPVPFFVYKYVVRLAVTTVALAQYLVVVLGYVWLIRGSESGAPISGIGVFMGLALSSLGGLVYFSLMNLIEMTSFWADNVWSLLVMLRFITAILSGAWLPLSLYPAWFVNAATWTPFPYFLYLPVQLAMGRAGWEQAFRGAGVLLVWEAVACFVMAKVWSRGLRQYSGVGI